jgi:hypothetical protein
VVEHSISRKLTSQFSHTSAKPRSRGSISLAVDGDTFYLGSALPGDRSTVVTQREIDHHQMVEFRYEI